MRTKRNELPPISTIQVKKISLLQVDADPENLCNNVYRIVKIWRGLVQKNLFLF